MTEPVCLECKELLRYDRWEDSYICTSCRLWYLPEDLGIPDNFRAPIFIKDGKPASDT